MNEVKNNLVNINTTIFFLYTNTLRRLFQFEDGDLDRRQSSNLAQGDLMSYPFIYTTFGQDILPNFKHRSIMLVRFE